ncbi:MAG TPA: DUF2279 domain-containing protein [Candidatus Kapabacteria bacterium]|jgi:hypothetical protein|nr:DUF2279 domain-containing protein [Candidatus Kapabacteria bacterium]HOV91817.1 DUF2279 domain-containing protein [Candidatus Kapabacteria bacterium]
MKYISKIYIIIIFFFNFNFLLSNEEINNISFTNLLNIIKLKNNNEFNNKQNSVNFNYFANSNELKKDSTNNFSQEFNPYIHISKEEFMYADDPRYTITGELPLKYTHIKPLNTAIVSATTLGIFIVQHELQQNSIWKRVGKFHFAEDIQYALWVDKFGHFYGSYFIGGIFNEALLDCGFSNNLSNILGGVLGLSYQTYIEILDGMSVDWGFSPSDFYSDLAGAAYFVAQKYIPFLQNFTPKYSYVNPKWIGEKDRNPHESFIDNYSAQNFWISINIRNIFGGAVRRYIPSWLQLSIGYAAYSMCSPGTGLCNPKVSTPITNDVWGNRKIIIALDYDFVKMLPDGPPIWNWFKQTLNYFKFPAPAIEFSFEGNTKFYFIYPFKFSNF